MSAIVVTGAGSGIGRELALKGARKGLHVAISDISQESLAGTVAELEAIGATCTAAVVDVRNAEELRAFASSISTEIRYVFANAGLLRFGTVADGELEAFKLMFDVNIMGLISTVQAFVPVLRAQSTRSTLALIGSTAAFFSDPLGGVYCATKHAVWAIAQSLRAALADEGAPIDVVMIAPGPVATAVLHRSSSTSPDPLDEVTDPDRTFGIPVEQAVDAIFDQLGGEAYLISTHPNELPAVLSTMYDTARAAIPVDKAVEEVV